MRQLISRYIVLFSFVSFPIFVFGQANTAGTPILPEELRVRLPGEKSSEDIDFFQLGYYGSTINLKPLIPLTDYVIPESVRITPPDLSDFEHVMVLVGIYGSLKNPEIIIWLTGDYLTNNITFFLDYDQDRNFNNDGSPVKMSRGDKPVQVLMNSRSGEHSMTLSVPRKRVGKGKERSKIMNQLTVSVQAGTGTGGLIYKTGGIGSPIQSYDVDLSEKYLGTSLTFDTKYVFAGLSFAYQNHFYYTSYLISPGRRTVVNNDKHPSNRIQYGLMVGLRIPVSTYIEIQPLVRLGMTSYTDPNYVKSIYDDDQVFHIPSIKFLEFGVRTQFTTGLDDGFFLEFARNSHQWMPEFPEVDDDNYTSLLKMWKIGVGYQFAISKPKF